MARKKTSKKKVNGITYFTSNYFAEKTYTSDRSARDFLRKYNSELNSVNPKLYSYETINKAIVEYELSQSKPLEVRKNEKKERKNEKMLKEEIKRAKSLFSEVKQLTDEEIKELESIGYDFSKPSYMQSELSFEEISKKQEDSYRRALDLSIYQIKNSSLYDSSDNFDIILKYMLINILGALNYIFNEKQLVDDIFAMNNYYKTKGDCVAKDIFEIEAFTRLRSPVGYLEKIND